jgi:hypothetical protein
MRHEHWTCPICDARGHCIECASLGTEDAYHRVQDLHAAAIQDENGIAAQVLEKIEALPHDLYDRPYWVSRMIQGALRQIGAAA